MKVICNKAGLHEECKNCGASKVHYDYDLCEPCPFEPDAKCVSVEDLNAENLQKRLRAVDYGWLLQGKKDLFIVEIEYYDKGEEITKRTFDIVIAKNEEKAEDKVREAYKERDDIRIEYINPKIIIT